MDSNIIIIIAVIIIVIIIPFPKEKGLWKRSWQRIGTHGEFLHLLLRPSVSTYYGVSGICFLQDGLIGSVYTRLTMLYH